MLRILKKKLKLTQNQVSIVQSNYKCKLIIKICQLNKIRNFLFIEQKIKCITEGVIKSKSYISQ